MLATLLLVALCPPPQTSSPIAPNRVSFFGRDGTERIQGIHHHEDLGQVFVAGNSGSALLSQKYTGQVGLDGSYDGLGDGFVARFTDNLNKLEAWTFLGGEIDGSAPGSGTPGDDRIYAVKTDAAGNVYAYGFSKSSQFFEDVPFQFQPDGVTPSVLHGGALQGRRDVFLAKLNNDLDKLYWVLRLGGNAAEATSGNAELEQGRNTLLVMDDGTCYISGGTNNEDFFDAHPGITPVVEHVVRQQQQASVPVVNPGNFDAFLAKVNPDGSLVWGTFFGGDGDESAYSGLSKRNGTLYVAGNVNDEDTNAPGQFWGQGSHPGSGLPGTQNALQPNYAGGAHPLGQGGGFHHIVGGDGFFARFRASTGELLNASYLGGSDFDEISGSEGFLVRDNGWMYLIGSTKSLDFPMAASGVPPFDPTHNSPGERDGFVTILTARGTEVLHSTYIGGGGFEELSGLAVDPYGFVYVSGNTDSAAEDVDTMTATTQYPVTANAFQCTNYQTYSASALAASGDPLPVTSILTKFVPTLGSLSYSTYFGGSVLEPSQSGPSTRDRVRSLFWATGDWCYVGGCTNSGDLVSVHCPQPNCEAPKACQPLAGPISTGQSPVDQFHFNSQAEEEDGFVARIKLPLVVGQ